MNDLKIRQVFEHSCGAYSTQEYHPSDIQQKAAHAVLGRKSGKLGYNIGQYSDCGHIQIHNNSRYNHSCPNRQAILREVWVDKRWTEVVDSPYFRVVFTPPHELSLLIYCNQKLLCGLLHRYCAETLLRLSAGKKYLGTQPEIIQVLHTWNQKLDYHVHMHNDEWDIMTGEVIFS